MAASGRPARLQAWQLEELARVLLNKPSVYGVETELWTLNRVGVLIHRMYGVKFGLTNIWLILGALGFSPQKPERRAIERDEGTVRAWKRSIRRSDYPCWWSGTACSSIAASWCASILTAWTD